MDQNKTLSKVNTRTLNRIIFDGSLINSPLIGKLRYVRLGRTLVKNGIYILSSFCKYLTLKFLHSASLPGLLIKGTSTFSEKVQSGTLQNG
jgi:hypothetical protein